MRAKFLLFSVAVVGLAGMWMCSPLSASAMSASWESQSDPHAPFAMISQRSLAQNNEPALVHVAAPNGGEVLTAGERYTIHWDTSGDALSYVTLSYTIDNGLTYRTIATAVPNYGTYAWRVPDVYAPQAMLRVQGTDLVDVLATDQSDAEFTLRGTPPSATSPVTGLPELLTDVSPGDVVQSPSFGTVYAIDASRARRPFETDAIRATYDDANEVVPVTDATLTTLALGTPMVPKPGVVLVRFAPAKTVYVVEGSDAYPILRAITREELAVSMYGDAWKSFVMTLPERYRNYYHGGSDIVTALPVSSGTLRTVDTLVY